MTNEYHSCSSPGAVVSALADDDCQSILVATADQPRTVAELVEECDIPTATAYRKVDRLAELDLLNEQIRVKPRGRNSREYLLCAKTVRVTLPEERASEISIKCTIAPRKPVRSQLARVSTDGGQLMDDRMSDEQYRLRKIFEDVTGTVGFVEIQEQAESPRYFDNERDATVSEYVTAAAKADGLSDAITTPEMGNERD